MVTVAANMVILVNLNRFCCSTPLYLASLTSAIISATRPRSCVSPFLLGIAVYIHRKYGSKELIGLLNNVGFSESYVEVQRYEYSLFADMPDSVSEQGFAQFVFDNADFNIRTIDGHNTFHSMGGIKCITLVPPSRTAQTVKRVLNPPKSSVIGSFANIPVETYHKPLVKGLSKIVIKDITSPAMSMFNMELIDALWISGCVIGASPRPSWGGFMHIVSCGSYDVSQVDALPFINMDPSNPSTIYTALRFALKESRKYNNKTCFVTFDQPLYIKAVEIVEASQDLAGVVVRLGGFHLLMSYMGAMGYIMPGSELEDLWGLYMPKNQCHT